MAWSPLLGITRTLGWTIVGIGMIFHEAVFATVAGPYDHGARDAIAGITLFAGLAGTLGWPATRGRWPLALASAPCLTS